MIYLKYTTLYSVFLRKNIESNSIRNEGAKLAHFRLKKR